MDATRHHAMRPGKRLRLALAILIAAGIAGVIFHRREPSYEGKTLSDWIVTMREQPRNDKARAVVRQLGSNSIPLLLDWLRQEERPTLKGRTEQSKARVIGWLESHKWIEPRPRAYYQDWKSDRRALANGVFLELGPAGKEAIPTLIQMLGDKTHNPDEPSHVAGAAYVVLPSLAPASIPPLIEALSNQDVIIWTLAAGALGNIGPSAKAAIPVLEKRLTDSNTDIRVNAADTIGKLGGNPNEFVPVIIQSLSEANFDVLDYRLEVLLHYKAHAKAAVPVLTNLLNRIPASTNITNTIARGQVISALQEIDPEAAAKAGVNPDSP